MQPSTLSATIRPPTGWRLLPLREVWHYRDLAYFLVWRNVKVRYKQTILGFAWAILQPLLTMVVFSIFFGGLIGVPSDGVPYPIFSYTALVPWTFFSGSLLAVSSSIVSSGSMLKKIYFPRVLVPISQVLSSFVDMLLALLVLVGIILAYSALTGPSAIDLIDSTPLATMLAPVTEVTLSTNIVWLPVFMLMAAATSLGVGLVLAAFNVQFRDIQQAVGFLVRLWMFLTPVIYPTSLIEGDWQWLYALNPMTGVIEGFRWAMLGSQAFPGHLLLPGVIISAALLVIGLVVFHRMEVSFADVV